MKISSRKSGFKKGHNIQEHNKGKRSASDSIQMNTNSASDSVQNTKSGQTSATVPVKKDSKKLRKKATQFKKGHAPLYKRKRSDSDSGHTSNMAQGTTRENVHYLRPKPQEAHLFSFIFSNPNHFQNEPEQDLQVHPSTSSASNPTVKLLRPSEDRLKKEGCHKIVNIDKLCALWHTFTWEHLSFGSSLCFGRLVIDHSHSEQYSSLAWRERVICNRCSYASRMFELM